MFALLVIALGYCAFVSDSMLQVNDYTMLQAYRIIKTTTSLKDVWNSESASYICFLTWPVTQINTVDKDMYKAGECHLEEDCFTW